MNIVHEMTSLYNVRRYKVCGVLKIDCSTWGEKREKGVPLIYSIGDWSWHPRFLAPDEDSSLIKKNLFIYKENKMGSGAKSYMRKGFLIYVWGNAQIFSPYLRRSLVIYDFAPNPSEFSYIQYEENFIFFFISALCRTVGPSQSLWRRKITNC
jgi:hypothetical protein